MVSRYLKAVQRSARSYQAMAISGVLMFWLGAYIAWPPLAWMCGGALMLRFAYVIREEQLNGHS